jgi:hypothetical protein
LFDPRLQPSDVDAGPGLHGWILAQRGHVFGDDLCRDPKPPHPVLEDVPISDGAFGETACPEILTATFA